MRSAKRAEIEQVDTRLRDEYDSRLLSELQRIRDETESKINDMKDDVERRYQNKLADNDSMSKRSTNALNALRDETTNQRAKIDELNNELQVAHNKITSLENKLREADDKLKKANNRYDLDMAARDSELASSRVEVQDLLNEYQELYDVKIALDWEIGAYRKMLESEEQRLNITASASVINGASLSGSFLSSDDGLRSGKKRRIAEEETSTISYVQSDTTLCDVKILDHDYEGKQVKLQNTGDKDVSIGGWILKRVAEDGEIDYKFHKSTIIKSGSTITVWGSNANANHEPPNDIVMKQQWSIADKMITLLIDKESTVNIFLNTNFIHN